MGSNLNTIGGSIWLNLLNTRRVISGHRIDILEDNDLFLKWLNDNEIFSSYTNLEKIKELREELYFIYQEYNQFNKFHENKLNGIMRNLPVKWVTNSENGELKFELEALDIKNESLVKILYSFIETTQNFGFEKIKQCSHDQCILFFLDTSKSGRRKWCSMETCGNKAKAHAHYRKINDKG
ncbi:CGNR zinc finger domain-containing protein [Metabacillus litoralis]|uniref:CGNR zinc finger domain-containing protein n=1 Tax=Metabacillus litoralis TaxID=152268 RepID=UPI00203E92F4|nr:CGNR zinc finger domain-containing protein [Metabacillus litoralis]MCM3409952.1 CGNR zinc finger domain-containing protein [Metabacillus litoralis]